MTKKKNVDETPFKRGNSRILTPFFSPTEKVPPLQANEICENEMKSLFTMKNS